MRVPYNYAKLRGKCAELDLTQDAIASEIGISPTSLNNKLTGKCQFKQIEMERFLGVLGEPVSMVSVYFFAH